ncbi:hypothetical protein MKX07_008027 [Trichoderma sp. CBMAI-0711]|nr:hypothetical protein MKX07_008027 [Trichoderma sp. CBMAI-0711]
MLPINPYLNLQDTLGQPEPSASILEFICLYTHDLRRKKKRWQDGKLKFHTFNKKYMVYDDGGGFVGDGHWQGNESEVAEGLEMNLDRGMAIVQLLECTGSREQDLGEVLGKRVREVEERRKRGVRGRSSGRNIAAYGCDHFGPSAFENRGGRNTAAYDCDHSTSQKGKARGHNDG